MSKKLTYTILSMSLLTVMAGAAVAPALGAIQAHFQDANPLLIQLIVSVPAFFIILTNFLFPLFCRYCTTRTLALMGLLLYVVSGTCCAMVNNIWTLLALRAVLGMSVGIIMPLSTGLLAYYFPPEEIAQLMGLSAAMNQLGGVVATMLAGLLASIEWRWSFLVYLIGLVAAVMVMLWLPKAHLSRPREPQEEATVDGTLWKRLRHYHPSVIGMLLLMMIFFIFPTHFALTGSRMGLNQPTITGLMVGLDVVAFFVGLGFGRLMHLTPRAMKYYAPALFCLGMISFAMAQGVAGLVLGCTLVGLANGIGVPYLNTIASIKGGRSAATTVMPLLSAALYLGQFLSPLLVSPLCTCICPDCMQGAYWIGAALALVMLIQTLSTRHFQSLPPEKKD